MTEAQKEALEALFKIKCRIADAEEENKTNECEDGPWCSARGKIKKAFAESEWDVQLPAKKK